VAALVWGVFVAPASPRELPDRWRLALELAILGGAAAARPAAARPALAAVLGMLAALNAALLRVWGQ
jgi:hypothetical protein